MSVYEVDAKVKELRELRNMEAEVKSAITAIEDSLKAEMLAKNTDSDWKGLPDHMENHHYQPL